MTVPPYWIRPYLNIEESSIIAPHESEKTQQESVNVPKTKKEPATPQKPLSQPITASASELIAFSKTISAKYGIDHEKFQATIQNESSFNPYAVEPTRRLSIGISQYTLDTWLEFCSNVDDRTDPYKSLSCMGRMWSQGLEYRWDAYCTHYYDLKCINLRGIYPIK